MVVVGIDIGTTHTKAVALTTDMQVVAAESASYPLHFIGDGGVEQNPRDWWDACCEVFRKLWSQGVNPEDIRCVAVSGHGCSVVAMDGSGNVLHPALSSLDTRCAVQTSEIRASAGELILEHNGNAVGAFNFEPKLRWLKDAKPEIYAQMALFLSATGYIAFRLTGEQGLNESDGGIAISYDRRNGGRWCDESIVAMGLDPDKFPRLLPCNEVLGYVQMEAAAETGLRYGTMVLAGGEDTSSAAFSLGITAPKQAYLSLGSQGTMGVCTDHYQVRPELLGFPHVLPGLHLLSGSMSAFGTGLNWFMQVWCKDLVDQAQRDPAGGSAIERLMALCEKTEPGAKGLLFLPYLSGELHPILDEHASGVFFGLRLDHTREDMARALLEGSAHAIRHNIEFAEKVSDPIEILRAIGGPTRSSLWCQIIADVTQRTVQLAGVNGYGGAPLGNALLAMSRVQNVDPAELVSSVISIDREYVPSLGCKSRLERYHELYKEIYMRIKDLFPLLKSEPD